MVRQFPAEGAGAFVVHDDGVGVDQGVKAGRQFPMADCGAGFAQGVGDAASSAWVSGAAAAQVGEWQMPIRGAVAAVCVRVAKVAAGDGAGEQRAVGDGAGKDADRVEAVGHDLHAAAADQAEGGLVADHAAKGRRADDAAGGLGAVGQREQAGADPGG